MNTFDSDAYGVDTDLPESVSDWFTPSKEDRIEAQEYFKAIMDDVLESIAEMNGIPYEVYSEWDRYDWGEFKECLDL